MGSQDKECIPPPFKECKCEKKTKTNEKLKKKRESVSEKKTTIYKNGFPSSR